MLPVDVYNNTVQSAFYTYFQGLVCSSYHIKPSEWKKRYNLQGTKSVAQYNANALFDVANKSQLSTVHEWDAAMIGMTGYAKLKMQDK